MADVERNGWTAVPLDPSKLFHGKPYINEPTAIRVADIAFPEDAVVGFVREIPHDPDDAAITTAVIAMAHSLRLRVVAEGVETEAQVRFLRERNCDEIQGFFFSRPLPAREVLPVLRRRADAQPDLARSGLGARHHLRPQLVDVSMLAHDERLHPASRARGSTFLGDSFRCTIA